MQNSQTTTLTDVMDPARAQAMQVLLGQSPDLKRGDALPPFFHQLYFWTPEPTERLGRDGHPKTGIGLIPDMGLPRRMWAGGRLAFHEKVVCGQEATKISTVEKTARKDGRSGPLAFVTLRHEIVQNGTTCVTEWQDLVYREDPAPGTPAPVPPQAPMDADVAEDLTFDSTMLFRYSALTFNGHRIHYDIDYAKEIEGYSGLVTHGPLLAQMLMLLADRQLGGLREFAFRATSPLMHFEPAAFCWRGDGRLWVRGPDGRQCMEATAA